MERNHQSEITIIVEKKESYQIDTQMTDTIIWEEGVVSILRLTEKATPMGYSWHSWQLDDDSGNGSKVEEVVL